MTRHDPVVDTTHSPHARLRALSISAVSITDGFWGPLLRTNREVTIPAAHRQCRDTGALDNFARAAGWIDGPFHAEFYSDSDVYKWVEAASWDSGVDVVGDGVVGTALLVTAVAAVQPPWRTRSS